jgi:DNA-directed RNA polymerase specialized sigma24 family protein
MARKCSVSQWISELEAGDSEAAAKIWRRYGARLLRLAQNRLGTTRRRVSDEEDIALTAFAQFCRGVQQKRFAKLEDRDDLWHLLVVLTVRKSVDQVRRETRRSERGESVFRVANDCTSQTPGIDQVTGSQFPPDLVVQSLEQCELLLSRLDDETLRQVALWKLEGLTNEEIAEKLGCVTRTVERKLAILRRKWEAFG